MRDVAAYSMAVNGPEAWCKVKSLQVQTRLDAWLSWLPVTPTTKKMAGQFYRF
ncbi:hypothetical protein GGTG_06516 [Gaeumannomyces tritici R3-111a-1]|uniref:Uncharacterized protein n=1 Tax=Gaeumannomyces tritici (strain R3-111a-1) TaxID=644352 RepID=J3NZ16_GAET3|nr:hypothetical protein GGTG_06516 [Gaeumannomyces tritici R3-111a-1]EJT76599.1 hypothetical protein GGTG_06516 [Gaeumannomyces tritici R3-111a-1]